MFQYFTIFISTSYSYLVQLAIQHKDTIANQLICSNTGVATDFPFMAMVAIKDYIQSSLSGSLV